MTLRPWLRSFQARSVATTLVTCLLLWGGYSLWAWAEASHERSRRFDDDLRQSAQMLLGAFPAALLARAEPTNFAMANDGVKLDAANEFNFQVWTRDRRLVGRSTTTPSEPLNPGFDTGFSTNRIQGMGWRVYSLNDASGEVQVQLGVSVEQAQDGVAQQARAALVDLLWLLPVLALCLLAVGMWTARPLRHLRDSVARRGLDDHTALSAAGLPSEAVPLVNAFNEMMQRAAQAREAQRRFVGDAAHELRTPLAALRVQAQVAMRTRNVAQRDAALARLVEGIDRTSRVTEQLLDLARMDSLQAEALPARDEPVNLAMLVARTVDGSRSLAERRHIEVRTQVEPLSVNSDSELLGIALRNVLDNALRYSPPDAGVDVVVTRQAGAVHLSVIDSGPGLSAEQRQDALQAFVRLGTGDEYGSGLGLSIVQRVSALLGIGFELLDAPSGRGLEARFTLTPRSSRA
jgi:two-component system, OmpR family, sensor histidine kinase QseC